MSVAENLWQRICHIERLCRVPMRPLTLKSLLQTAQLPAVKQTETAEWVREELTVRLAHRVGDFHRLPFFVLGNPYIRSCYNIHCGTLDRLTKVPPIKIDLLGQGLHQLRFVTPDVALDPFLERFFFFRIGRRLMIDHLVALDAPPQPNWAGCIHLKCCPATIIQDCSRRVRDSCRITYGLAPDVVVTGNLDCQFPFIPDHLALIVTETLKNALRATVEFYTFGTSIVDGPTKRLVTDDSDVPPVVVDIQRGFRDVVIKVSDKGGGIPAQRVPSTFRFGYSTVAEFEEKMAKHYNLQSQGWIRPDMAGYGFGLPLSRAFARYFGGNIHLQPCLGVGTEVFITLNYVGDSEEPLVYDTTGTSSEFR